MAKKTTAKKPGNRKLNHTDELAVLGIKLNKAKKAKVVRAVMDSFVEGKQVFEKSKRHGNAANAWLHRAGPTFGALQSALGIPEPEHYGKPRGKWTLEDLKRGKLQVRLRDSVDGWITKLFNGHGKRQIVKELAGLDVPYEEAAARIMVNLTLRLVNGESLDVTSSELATE